MTRTGCIHHFGTFLLFAGAALLLVTTISAPVVGDLSMLKVTLTNSTQIRHSSVTFGTFGHCILDVPPVTSDQDFCFKRTIGYSPMRIMEQIDGVSYNTASIDTADSLTRVMIIHPIACGIAFIAFFLALGAGFIGSIFAAIAAFLAWVLTLVVLITDFVSWGIVKTHVNGDGSGSHAIFGVSMWTELGAMVALFLGMFIIFISSCSGNMHRNRSAKGASYDSSAAPATTTTGRRRWGFRRNRGTY